MWIISVALSKDTPENGIQILHQRSGKKNNEQKPPRFFQTHPDLQKEPKCEAKAEKMKEEPIETVSEMWRESSFAGFFPFTGFFLGLWSLAARACVACELACDACVGSCCDRLWKWSLTLREEPDLLEFGVAARPWNSSAVGVPIIMFADIGIQNWQTHDSRPFADWQPTQNSLFFLARATSNGRNKQHKRSQAKLASHEASQHKQERAPNKKQEGIEERRL